jgi:hypothetical protein
MVARALLPSFCWSAATASLAWAVASPVSVPLLACAAGGSAGLAVYLAPHFGEVRRLLADELNRRRSSQSVVAIGPAT